MQSPRQLSASQVSSETRKAQTRCSRLIFAMTDAFLEEIDAVALAAHGEPTEMSTLSNHKDDNSNDTQENLGEYFIRGWYPAITRSEEKRIQHHWNQTRWKIWTIDHHRCTYSRTMQVAQYTAAS